jgi:hypothetical protein
MILGFNLFGKENFTMNVKILRGTIVNGKPAFPDDTIEVDTATGQMLVRSGKAALVDKADLEAAEADKTAAFARGPNDLMGNNDPRVTAGGTQETPTPLNNVAPPGTLAGGHVEVKSTGTLTGAMGESESGKFDDDFDDSLNDPLGLNPKGGLTTKSANPIERAETR